MRKVFLVVLAILLSSVEYTHPSDEAVQFFQDQMAMLKGDLPIASSDPQSPPIKCGTPLLVGINLLKYNGLELPSGLLETRPETLPLTFGSDHVLVHYADSGEHVPYQVNVDTLPADGVPDFINRVSEIFESVWEIETGNPDSGYLGFNPPLSDDGRGGDNRYDVYVMNLGTGYYGFTVPEGVAGQYQISSFIELENDFAGTLYGGNPVNGVKVTAAHELFHAIQFRYDALEFDYEDVGDPSTYKPWWMEASAVWMEEVVYDELNDYVNYLPYFYDYPWMNLGTFSYTPGDPRAYHSYASCVWPIYLTEKYETGIVKEIWEGCAAVPGYNTLIVTNNAMIARSSSLADAFTEFSIWNYHTGPRANPTLFYSEGALFDEINPTFTINPPISEPISIGGLPNPPEHLGANYIVVQTGPSSGGLSFSFDGVDIANAGWHATVLGYNPLSSEWIDFAVNPSTGVGSLEWYNWNLYDNLVLIPTVSGITPYYNSYTYTGSISYDSSLYGENIVYVWPGDLDNNAIVNEEDILPLAVNWFEVGNSRTQITMNWSPLAIQLWNTPSATFADANGSGRVDIRDFLAICLNWGSTHSGTFTYGLQSPDFNLDAHRSVLELIYDEVKNANSGPQYEIRLYLEKMLGITIPDEFILKQNYPNPFNSSTVIEYLIAEKTTVRLTVFNLLGQRVKSLLDAEKSAGVYRIEWDGRDDDGRDVASGIYLYRLESPSGDITRKMVLIR
ncbi:MAG: T9SS type A sorting domain-containing protein [Candidatus Zixiibacteriota bacterium]|nr:MAG: T9SS type A sorting domain-containing protein [candidate division Zixibacteria bacterium]